MLDDDQKADLLRIAREAIAGRILSRAPAGELTIRDLPEASGVFVTIKRRGELRGCLGTLQCAAGLADEVARCARDSATEDPRFLPVAAAELTELSLDISILGPLELIDPLEPESVIIGRNGLVVEDGHRRGLLLPQVAVEWGWNAEQFLRQTCRKAGLAPDSWRNGARVYRFEAEVFGD
jgi:uncharacterized protein